MHSIPLILLSVFVLIAPLGCASRNAILFPEQAGSPSPTLIIAPRLLDGAEIEKGFMLQPDHYLTSALMAKYQRLQPGATMPIRLRNKGKLRALVAYRISASPDQVKMLSEFFSSPGTRTVLITQSKTMDHSADLDSSGLGAFSILQIDKLKETNLVRVVAGYDCYFQSDNAPARMEPSPWYRFLRSKNLDVAVNDEGELALVDISE